MGAGADTTTSARWIRGILSLLTFLAALYIFFICIELFGASFKVFGKDAGKAMLVVTDNPMIGLLLGILATSLMQSSSTTTTVIVGLVGSGVLTVEQAVPMVMGANIGTTITATIVAMGHIRRRAEFQRAFSGAVVHDFFNLCSVLLFLPLEILFHPIEKTARFISEALIGVEGTTFKSPLKAIVKPIVEAITDFGNAHLHREALVVCLLLLAIASLVFALSVMVKTMGRVMAGRIERVVDNTLGDARPEETLLTRAGKTMAALAMGTVLTALVQSSSVTTSLAIPLIGAGIVTLRTVFPFMVGANIGTTVTALLASMVTGEPAAVTLALCHLTFNVFGTAVFLPLSFIPIRLAHGLGRISAIRRWVAPLFVAVVFFGIPGLIVWLS